MRPIPYDDFYDIAMGLLNEGDISALDFPESIEETVFKSRFDFSEDESDAPEYDRSSIDGFGDAFLFDYQEACQVAKDRAFDYFSALT